MSLINTGQRILALDLMRGYFLLVILVDHLGKFPGFFEVFTGKGWLWVSAAEGFFIISGMMVGLIRGKELKSKGFKKASTSLLKRSAELYIWGVALTVVFTILGWAANGHPGIKDGLMESHSIGQLIWQTVTLQYIYGWADFLMYYAAFMLIAPLALWLTSKKQAWLVILISFGIWQFRTESMFAALQILFVAGLIVGYNFRSIQAWFSNRSITIQGTIKRSVLCIAGSTALLSIGVVHGREWLGYMNAQESILYNTLNAIATTTGPWFDKWTMAPGRVALSLVWFAALYVIFRKYEKRITTVLGWLLLPLGRNSLNTYIAQSLIVFAAWVLWPVPQNFIMNITINVVAIALLAELIYIYSYGRIPGYPPAKYWKDLIAASTQKSLR